jgi:putative ABC transport system permease protein
MSIFTVYNIFARDFRKQRKRIFLTLIALGWGTISIMLLLAFGEGLHRQLMVNKAGLGTGIGILWGGQTSIPFKGLGKGRPIRFMFEDVEYIKKRIPEIGRIGGEYHRWGVRIKYKDMVLAEHITGINPDFEQMRAHIPQQGGRMIDQLDMEHRRRVVFLGDELKSRLCGDDDPVGKIMYIDNIPFTIIGVMKPKLQMGSYAGGDEDKLSMPSTTFKSIYGYRFLNNIVYQAKNLDDMPAIESKLFASLGAKHKFDPADDRALSIWDVVSGTKELNNMMIGIKVFLGIIGGLTLVIAGVGVANIMYVSIKERTREIGIKMAVGARKIYILTQFLLEALMITFLGGAGGIFVSWMLTEGFKQLPIESDVLEFMGRPTISFEIGLTVVIILGIIGLISGIFPAMRAASVNPVESLRYE